MSRRLVLSIWLLLGLAAVLSLPGSTVQTAAPSAPNALQFIEFYSPL